MSSPRSQDSWAGARKPSYLRPTHASNQRFHPSSPRHRVFSDGDSYSSASRPPTHPNRYGRRHNGRQRGGWKGGRQSVSSNCSSSFSEECGDVGMVEITQESDQSSNIFRFLFATSAWIIRDTPQPDISGSLSRQNTATSPPASPLTNHDVPSPPSPPPLTQDPSLKEGEGEGEGDVPKDTENAQKCVEGEGEKTGNGEAGEEKGEGEDGTDSKTKLSSADTTLEPTPTTPDTPPTLGAKVRLEEVWCALDQPYGHSVYVNLRGNNNMFQFVPSLSAVQLFHSAEDPRPTPLFEFFEFESPSSRLPVFEKALDLSESSPCEMLLDACVGEIDPAQSWFALLWQPVRCFRRTSAALEGSFLTYHSLTLDTHPYRHLLRARPQQQQQAGRSPATLGPHTAAHTAHLRRHSRDTLSGVSSASTHSQAVSYSPHAKECVNGQPTQESVPDHPGPSTATSTTQAPSHPTLTANPPPQLRSPMASALRQGSGTESGTSETHTHPGESLCPQLIGFVPDNVSPHVWYSRRVSTMYGYGLGPRLSPRLSPHSRPSASPFLEYQHLGTEASVVEVPLNLIVSALTFVRNRQLVHHDLDHVRRHIKPHDPLADALR